MNDTTLYTIYGKYQHDDIDEGGYVDTVYPYTVGDNYSESPSELCEVMLTYFGKPNDARCGIGRMIAGKTSKRGLIGWQSVFKLTSSTIDDLPDFTLLSVEVWPMHPEPNNKDNDGCNLVINDFQNYSKLCNWGDTVIARRYNSL